MQQTSLPKGFAKFLQEFKRLFQKMFGVHTNSNKSEWDVEPEELKKLYDRLIANTDELSRQVAARFIARRLSWEPVWDTFSKVLPLMLPLDYEDQERIKVLCNAYDCPYKLPVFPSFSPEHQATHFSFNQFPLEIQRSVVGKDILDGGGFVGDSAMVFTEYAPKKVYVFEPNPDTLPVLKQTLVENAVVLGNRKDLIEIVPLALGKSKGTLTFHSNGEADGGATTTSSHTSRMKTNTYQVDMISIDEFAGARALDVGLIKLDVEGVEYDTILGAKDTIIKQKPLLLISIYHKFRDFFEIKPLIESWDVGYKFEIRHHHPSAPDWEFVLMAY